MYAVIQTGGKQYRVQPGDIVQVEMLEGDVGSNLTFGEVLFLSKANGDSAQITLGKPLIANASVTGEVVGQGRGEKILIIKMKRRKQYRRTQGHRQNLTQVLVTGIDNGSGEKVALDAETKKAKMSKFQSHLKAKGLASTPKTLGSRKKLAAKKAAAPAAEAAATAEKKAPAKKKTATKKAAAAK